MGSSSDVVEGDPLYYSREMIHKRLGPFTDLPLVVPLMSEFLVELRDQSLASGRIPPGRVAKWTASASTVKVDGAASGQIMRDYRLWDAGTGGSSSKVMSFDIKTKAGYRSFSPLVDPRRRTKFRVARYQLFQQRIREGKGIIKGYMKKNGQPCAGNYDPLDLYSGDSARAKRALEAIIECPHNNLCIWDGNKVYWDHSTVGDVSLTSQEWMIDALSVILAEETVLPSLLRLQKLDILDADGAILVYERLSQLGGTNLLDMNPPTVDGMKETVPALMEGSPIRPPNERPHLDEYCELVQSFTRDLDRALPGLPSQDTLDEARRKGLHLVSRFSVEECVYLLQNWLLSLDAVDVSVITSFRFSEHRQTGAGTPTILRLQKGESPGVLGWSDTETTVEYRIKIIDYDRKPSQKLQKRSVKEDLWNGIQVT